MATQGNEFETNARSLEKTRSGMLLLASACVNEPPTPGNSLFLEYVGYQWSILRSPSAKSCSTSQTAWPLTPHRLKKRMNLRAPASSWCRRWCESTVFASRPEIERFAEDSIWTIGVPILPGESLFRAASLSTDCTDSRDSAAAVASGEKTGGARIPFCGAGHSSLW